MVETPVDTRRDRPPEKKICFRFAKISPYTNEIDLRKKICFRFAKIFAFGDGVFLEVIF